MKREVMALAVTVIVSVSSLAVYALYFQGPCEPTRATQTVTDRLTTRTIGAVTEYELPNSTRFANAVTVAPDGSVWFGEQGTPGVGHLVPESGTLTEYRWACYPTTSNGGIASSIWGITLWNGHVWAADGDTNRLVGLDPSSGATTYVNTTTATFPYLLAVAPDDSLWFTALSSPAKLGRVGPDLRPSLYPAQGLGRELPVQVAFVNSSLAYMVALNPSRSNDSGLYSFDPSATVGTVVAHRVGGNFGLFFPQGLSVSGGKIWVSQHYPSNVVVYDTSTGEWTTYPTSTISYETTTLPYFVQVSGEAVWFNEHYADRIALLDPGAGTLTEYSESDPPATGAAGIQNDLTIAAVPTGAWFTSTTANYIGFVDGTEAPGFNIAAVGPSSTTLSASGSETLTFRVGGTWGATLSVEVSDSENYTSVPSLISIQPGVGSIPAGSGPVSFTVDVGAKAGLQPGKYTLAVTVSDGLVSQTKYIFVTVP